MKYQIKQGEDLVLQIPVLDNSNREITLTSATKIRVALTVRNLEVKKYLDSSLESAISGYGDISINTTNNYMIDLNLIREDSKSFPLGELSATVLLEFADATLTDKRYEYTYLIGTISKGILKSEDLSI